MIRASINLPRFKLWKLKTADEKDTIQLSAEARLETFLARTLVSRNIKTVSSYFDFTNPSISQFNDPFLFSDMERVVTRLLSAVEMQERVLIYGDYDVDGITSTASLILFFRELGLDVDYHIPDRQEHGYGLSIHTLKQLKDENYTLIITVDCGISAFEEVEYLNQKQIDIIITDHHMAKDDLPNAYAIIATSKPDCDYPFKMLAGVGVVFKVIQAISIRIGQESLFMKFIDLVALGTVADVVSLTGENRAIVDVGLKSIKEHCNIGLKALIDSVDTGDKQNEITSWTFGFVLAPRINAAGRVSDPKKAVEMLITTDYSKAYEIAKQLCEDNLLRRQTEQQITTGVIERVTFEKEFKEDKVIIIADENWHQGVIGIVASRMVDKFYKPVVIISLDEEEGKGSARSIEGFNIYEALQSCADLMVKFGGHAPAAGLTIKLENIEKLRKALNEYANNEVDDIVFQPKLNLDANIETREISFQTIAEISKLEPFGCGNQEPTFWMSGMEVVEAKILGADMRHLKMTLKKDGQNFNAIAFNMGSLYLDIISCKKIDIACYAQKNVWNGFTKIQLRILEIQFPTLKLARDAFYNTCDKIYSFFETNKNPNKNSLQNQYSMSASIKKAFMFDEGKTRTAILINDIDAIEETVKMLEINNIDSRIYAGNELVWCNGTGCVQNEESIHLIVLINPIPGKLPKIKFKNFILVGTWKNKAYKDKVIESIKTRKVPVEDYSNQISDPKDLVPSVQELRCIYQHIKTTCLNEDVDTNIFTLASLIANSYKIEINSFKLKKALEIFEEAKLISLEEEKDDTIRIDILQNNQTKGDLMEKSKVYRFLLDL